MKFVCCKGGRRECSRCIKDSLDGQCSYPAPLLIFSTTKDTGRPSIFHESGEVSVSATQLNPCHRRTIIGEVFDHDVDPAQYISMLVGSGWHAMMDKHFVENQDNTRERRVFRAITIGGINVEVHGTPDLHDLDRELIFDWKTTNKPMDCESVKFCFDAPPEEYVNQLNVYAWLVEEGTYEDGEPVQAYVSRAFLNVLGKNGGIGKQANKWVTKTFQVPLWYPEVVEQHVRSGVMPFVEFAKHGALPAVLPDTKKGERHWMCRSCQVREMCDKLAEEGR